MSNKHKKHKSYEGSKSINHIKNSRSKGNKHIKKGRKGRDCIYYNNDKKSCNMTKRLCNFCSYFTPKSDDKSDKTGSKKRTVKSKLSPYNEDYLARPFVESTHEKTNEYIGLSKNIGTPVHVGYMKSNDKRRHKNWCIWFEKVGKICKYFASKCPGSSRCEKYEERKDLDK